MSVSFGRYLPTADLFTLARPSLYGHVICYKIDGYEIRDPASVHRCRYGMEKFIYSLSPFARIYYLE